jgi:hypothetical protein
VSLRVVPVAWRPAARFVYGWHRRHRKPPRGFKFCVGVADDGDVLVGVAMVGRPVARMLDDGLTLEINRTATSAAEDDDHPARNANSMLYGASARAAKALGYHRVITYNEDGESGASLRGAGFELVASRPPHPGWDRPSRRRDDGGDPIRRNLWQRVCNQDARPWTTAIRPDGEPAAQGDLFEDLEAS